MRLCARAFRAPALAVIVAASLWNAGTASATPGGAAGGAVRAAEKAIAELRIEDARRLINPVIRSHPNDADVLHVEGLLRFHEGDYGGAARALERSIKADPPKNDNDGRVSLLALVRATRDATAKYVEVRSPDGRFVVRHAPGPDAHLVPYALEALGAADQALTEDLGYRVPGPVRLEIFPTAASLAEVSTLSVEAIERTGTIALCKWDRLMVTSPRALVRGYPWVDTIVHEFVHLVLARASHDRAPVWFQEGVAKFLERRWRGTPPKAGLDPAAEGLLHKALTDGELIPFEKLHPSIALLPSQEAAALAFAQVATFVETFQNRYGGDALRHAIHFMADGEDARRALAAVAGVRFADLERLWREGLKDRKPAEEGAPPLLSLRFKRGGAPDESLEVQVDQARRHMRLGDLLWDRNRPGAAKVEYYKAHVAAPRDPIVASRLSRAALASGDADQALEAIEPVARRYPDHAPARAALSAAYLAKGRREAAREEAYEAIAQNPFDPEPHCVLGAATDDDAVRRREERTCLDLGGVAR